MKHCRECGVELVVGENWYSSQAKRNNRICKECHKAYVRMWQATNYSRHRANVDRWQREGRRNKKLQEERWAETERGVKYIYLLHAPEVDRYKIGQSSNPERRAHHLSMGPVEVVLLWAGLCNQAFFVEPMLHARFRPQRVRGEWFQSLTDEQIAFIKEQASKETR